MHSGWKTKNKKQNIEASGHVPGASFVCLIGMPLMCCIGYDLRAGFCVLVFACLAMEVSALVGRSFLP